MRIKDTSVETEFHPILTSFLFYCDHIYRHEWLDELVITSGSEDTAKHGDTSLHYNIPCQAADIRTWDASVGRGHVPTAKLQQSRLKKAAKEFLEASFMPTNWIDIVLEKDHIHIEFQPKRIYERD